MTVTGTVRDGTIILDPGTLPIQDGTRVQVALTSGMEPLIRKTPGVCGGSACVRRTRLAVWMLVNFRNLGATDETILGMYDGLTADDAAAAWSYYDANREEIDTDIRENDAAGED